MKRLWSVVVVGCLSFPVFAASWQPVAGEGRLAFVATYEGAQAPGVFHDFETTLTFDPDHPEAGRLQVRVDLGSADMRSADINEAIHGPSWLAVTSDRWAEFDSTAIRPSGSHRFIATGTLTLKGNRHPVQVPFTWTEQGGGAVLEGSTTVDRTAFDVGSGEWARPDEVGVKVEVRYHVVFRQGP